MEQARQLPAGFGCANARAPCAARSGAALRLVLTQAGMTGSSGSGTCARSGLAAKRHRQLRTSRCGNTPSPAAPPLSSPCCFSTTTRPSPRSSGAPTTAHRWLWLERTTRFVTSRARLLFARPRTRTQPRLLQVTIWDMSVERDAEDEVRPPLLAHLRALKRTRVRARRRRLRLGSPTSRRNSCSCTRVSAT